MIVPIEPTTRPSRFQGLSIAFLAVAIHYAAIRAAVGYMGSDPSTILALVVLPAVITLWVLPPARRHGLHRWPVLWFLYATSPFPVVILVVGETWILHRFFAVDFPGQSKWARHGTDTDGHTANRPARETAKGSRQPQDRQAKKKPAA